MDTTQHTPDTFPNLGAGIPVISHRTSPTTSRPGFELDERGQPVSFVYTNAYPERGNQGRETPPPTLRAETHPQEPTIGMTMDTPIGRNGGGSNTPVGPTTKPIIISVDRRHRFGPRGLGPVETQITRSVHHKIVSSLGGVLKELRDNKDDRNRTAAIMVDYDPEQDEKTLVEEIIAEASAINAKVILLLKDRNRIAETQGDFAPPPDVFGAETSLPFASIASAINSQLLKRSQPE